MFEEEEIPHPELAAEIPGLETYNYQMTPGPSLLEDKMSDAQWASAAANNSNKKNGDT